MGLSLTYKAAPVITTAPAAVVFDNSDLLVPSSVIEASADVANEIETEETSSDSEDVETQENSTSSSEDTSSSSEITQSDSASTPLTEANLEDTWFDIN